jgi:hypothetical protein
MMTCAASEPLRVPVRLRISLFKFLLFVIVIFVIRQCSTAY